MEGKGFCYQLEQNNEKKHNKNTTLLLAMFHRT